MAATWKKQRAGSTGRLVGMDSSTQAPTPHNTNASLFSSSASGLLGLGDASSGELREGSQYSKQPQSQQQQNQQQAGSGSEPELVVVPGIALAGAGSSGLPSGALGSTSSFGAGGSTQGLGGLGLAGAAAASPAGPVEVPAEVSYVRVSQSAHGRGLTGSAGVTWGNSHCQGGSVGELQQPLLGPAEGGEAQECASCFACAWESVQELALPVFVVLVGVGCSVAGLWVAVQDLCSSIDCSFGHGGSEGTGA